MGELGEGVGPDAGLGLQVRGRRCRRGESDDVTILGSPGVCEDAHGGRLAGAGGGDADLEAGAAGGHLRDQIDLAGVECGAVRGRLDHRHPNCLGCHCAAAGHGGGVADAGFGGQDPRARVEVVAGVPVDASAVRTSQDFGVIDGVKVRRQCDREVGDHGLDEVVDDALDVLDRAVSGPDLPLGFGPHVGRFPRGPP